MEKVPALILENTWNRRKIRIKRNVRDGEKIIETADATVL